MNQRPALGDGFLVHDAGAFALGGVGVEFGAGGRAHVEGQLPLPVASAVLRAPDFQRAELRQPRVQAHGHGVAPLRAGPSAQGGAHRRQRGERERVGHHDIAGAVARARAGNVQRELRRLADAQFERPPRQVDLLAFRQPHRREADCRRPAVPAAHAKVIRPRQPAADLQANPTPGQPEPSRAQRHREVEPLVVEHGRPRVVVPRSEHFQKPLAQDR